MVYAIKSADKSLAVCKNRCTAGLKPAERGGKQDERFREELALLYLLYLCAISIRCVCSKASISMAFDRVIKRTAKALRTRREEKRKEGMSQDFWNYALYEGSHSFVWQYGEALLELLDPKAGERILDLGCGTGQLTEKIALTGAFVYGIDSSLSMIAKAQSNYHYLNFAVADARNFQVDEPLDAVFSNAVLHWIKEPDAVINCVKKSLKPGGRFVAEFGGKGNVQAIVRGLLSVLSEIGCEEPESLNPWYYPSIGEYAGLLEDQGFEVSYAVLFDRPTFLEGGNSGMANWIEMFAGAFLLGLSEDVRSQVIQAVVQRLRSTQYHDGNWMADYRRIRVVATIPLT